MLRKPPQVQLKAEFISTVASALAISEVVQLGRLMVNRKRNSVFFEEGTSYNRIEESALEIEAEIFAD